MQARFAGGSAWSGAVTPIASRDAWPAVQPPPDRRYDPRRMTYRARTPHRRDRADSAPWKMPDADIVEKLLQDSRAGSARAVDELFAALYETLRGFARAAMADQSGYHTLQATALVNETYVRLIRHRGGWQGRAQFLSTAARAMRSVLVDHARTKKRLRRTPRGRRVHLDRVLVAYQGSAIDVLVLDDLLRKLTKGDARAAQVVELRFFGGMSLPDVAALLGVPLRSVERDWQWARTWLRAHIE